MKNKVTSMKNFAQADMELWQGGVNG